MEQHGPWPASGVFGLTLKGLPRVVPDSLQDLSTYLAMLDG